MNIWNRCLVVCICLIMSLLVTGPRADAASASAQELFEKGYAAFDNKEFSTAESLFREGLKLQDIDVQFRALATYYLAETLRLQNKSTQEAIGLYQEVVRLIPNTKEAVDSAAKARTLAAAPAQTEERPTTLAFKRDGSWAGQVTAMKWGGINTAKAWAVGKASEQDLRDICYMSSGNGSECVQRMAADPPIEIFANCEERTTWQTASPERWRLSEVVAGKRPASHRAQETVASWFEILCPKAWASRTRR